ncbi:MULTISPECIES: hypothetical protein [Trichocoleus]|uniref:Uncharacterized protein n=1 Tax=Trichocoleus desertorum GB2-A4 TaxID=2933944 RepID=A0ABV0JA25_9CYAN|nr:hypothetical protein [Trichocoleus sp. FACHB-46]MBD1862833.1 hypothetical protein [Trichocoleus sp. FACHB-46]
MTAVEWLQMIKLVGVVGFGKIRTLGGACPQTPAEGRLCPPDPLQK